MDSITNKNKNSVLIIKLSPMNGLNSSMLRTFALIKGLLINGFEIDFLTIKESGTTILNDVSRYDFLNEINIIYANANATYDRIVSSNKGIKGKLVSVLRKIYHTFSMYDYSKKIAESIELNSVQKQYKYVISVSDPKSSHIAMISLINKGLKYSKWIQYWGDPFSTDITNKSIYPKFIYRKSEIKLFNNCDSIIYTSPFTVEEQKKLFPAYGTKMNYIPTAFIEEKNFEQHSGKFTIGYYGAYDSTVRNILPLYNACSLIKEVDLFIVGNSDIELATTNNISIYPRGDISEYEKKTDLFVCVLNSSGTQIPGKVYHYAATNRPILIVLDGEKIDEMSCFFQQFNRYELCVNNEESITSSINRIIHQSKSYKPYKEFSCANIARRIIES